MVEESLERIREEKAESISTYVTLIEQIADSWTDGQQPWLRGECATFDRPLLPKLFREVYDENALLQFFRARAAVLNLPVRPRRDETDCWLFLARHFGLPTRLLDWTEGGLIALFFALREKQPVVWMLNPLELNQMSDPRAVANMPIITWLKGKDPGSRNIRAAWEIGEEGTAFPIAFPPTVIHPRLSVQRSGFTIHGADHRPLTEIVGGECLTRIRIEIDQTAGLRQLRRLGISDSALFPDLEGLARELEATYRAPQQEGRMTVLGDSMSCRGDAPGRTDPLPQD